MRSLSPLDITNSMVQEEVEVEGRVVVGGRLSLNYVHLSPCGEASI